ncbi:MAG: hypothetical protein ACK52P_01335 [Alphaproteobacteria bacterium]|jgi:hypothetical protein
MENTRSSAAQSAAEAKMRRGGRQGQQRRADAAAGSPAAAAAVQPPSFLLNCGPLPVQESCDTVYFSQIFELASQKTPDRPLVHPCQVHDRLRYIAGREKLISARLSALAAKLVDARGKYREIPPERLVELQLSARRPPTRFGRIPLPAASTRKATRVMTAAPAGGWSPLTPGKGGLTGLDSLDGQLRDLFAEITVPRLPPAAQPTVALAVVYRQEWCTLGYHRGRLIRTVPLTADGKKEIVVKSWVTRKHRREENQSVAEDISTEFIGDQKWSLTTLKEVSANMNGNINGNLKADLSVPIPSTPATVGAGGGVGGNAGGSVNGLLRETEERIAQATVKAANSLKTTVSSVVETAEETGAETTITETIVNPNKCRSLMYDFFEVVETFAIRTAVDRIDPLILLPIKLEAVTPEWVLCHECLLRKYLPCDVYYPGFEAAKRLRVADHLGQFTGSLAGPEADAAGKAVLDAILAVVTAYHSLSSATLQVVTDGSGGSGLPGQIQKGFDDLVKAVGDGLNATGEAFGDAVEAVGDAADALGKTVSDGVQTFAGWLGFGTARSIAAIGAQARSGSPGGGIGSYIYWEVAKIAAPEIPAALEQLAGAHAQISTMQPGPARTNAIFRAVEAFFATAGDITEGFKKIDVALFFLFAGVTALASVSGAFLGALAAAAIIIVSGGAAAIPIALVLAGGFLGGAVVGGLTALGGQIAVALGSELSKADLVPDDIGLKASIMGLYGLQGNLGGAIGLPAAPQADSPEAVAAYQQQLIELKREQREQAEARVEFDRLKCHLQENLVYYTQLIMQRLPEATLQQILSTHAIPLGAVEPRIVGFAGRKVGFRVLSASWLAASGFDFSAARDQFAADEVFRPTAPVEVTLPTPGVSVEPRLGACDACEPFVEAHRALDLDLKAEEVAREALENERRRQRIAAGNLEDPVSRDAHISVGITPGGSAPLAAGGA